MKKTLATLYYVHDPMCSWCWGFRRTWLQLQAALTGRVNIQTVLGGLAVDTEQPMPLEMQRTIRQTWQRIQQEIPGTEFNYDFWNICQPRRSTYPACRAVIAAGMQGEDHTKLMLIAIQQAYYLRAKNPSDDDVLLQLAIDVGLDAKQFKTDYYSDECQQLFAQQRQLTAALGVRSFPTLVLCDHKRDSVIHINYTQSKIIVSSILDRL